MRLRIQKARVQKRADAISRVVCAQIPTHCVRGQGFVAFYSAMCVLYLLGWFWLQSLGFNDLTSVLFIKKCLCNPELKTSTIFLRACPEPMANLQIARIVLVAWVYRDYMLGGPSTLL